MIPHTVRRRLAFMFQLSALAAFGGACAETSTSSSGGSTPAAATCADACGAVERLCGTPASACLTACPDLSNAARTCLVSASSCSAAASCESLQDTADAGGPAPQPTKDAGGGELVSTATNRPNGKCSHSLGETCKKGQYCVARSSVASETGCVDLPVSCNGSTTDFCLCFAQAGFPCSKGSTSCSTVGGNIAVDCR